MSDMQNILAAIKFLVDDNQKLRQEIEELKQWKETQINTFSPFLEFVENRGGMKVGESITKKAMALIEERDRLREGIEQLIEDYERRIKSIDELLSEDRNPENGLSNTLKFSRLSTKKSHFQTVKAELERLLKD